MRKKNQEQKKTNPLANAVKKMRQMSEVKTTGFSKNTNQIMGL